MDLGELYRTLGEDEFSVLKAMVSLISRYEYVPIETLEKRVKIPPKKLGRSILRLGRINALIKGQGSSYKITFLGLDLLAIHLMTLKGIISSVGTQIGTGKESDIYNALTLEGIPVAIKFYRIGRTSFQKVSRYRSYLTDKVNWIVRSITAAEREFNALRVLSKYTQYVPKVFGRSYHAVAMEYITGIELQKYFSPSDPLGILKKILNVLKVAYTKVRLVHGDLSEYNIIVSKQGNEEKPYIIDWPQYLYVDDPLHELLLERDIKYLINFFKRRYGVVIDFRNALRFVKGEIDEV